jgi:hypothetical protein
MRDRVAAIEKGYDELRQIVDRHMRRQTRRLELIVVVLIIGGGAAAYQQTVLISQQHRLDEQAVEQRAGRQLGIRTTCAVQSAVIQAAISTIHASTTVGSPRFEANLRRLGYPPLAVRRRSADRAARAYAVVIAAAVRDEIARGNTSPARRGQTSPMPKGLVRRDGTLNCTVLVRAAGATVPAR